MQLHRVVEHQLITHREFKTSTHFYVNFGKRQTVLTILSLSLSQNKP